MGAALVIGASAAFGLGSMWRMSLRVRVLRDLLTALGTMKNEICDRTTPLPTLIDHLAAETKPPVYRFFHRLQQKMADLGTRSFYAIWREAVEESGELELEETERATLADLGKTLGRYDIEEQAHTLRYTIRRLEGFLERAEEKKRLQGKVHAVLGMAVGVFVVLILL